MIRCLIPMILVGALFAAEQISVDLDLRNRPLVEAVQQLATQLRVTLIVESAVNERLDTLVTVRAQRQPLEEIVSWLRRDHRLAVRRDGAVLRISDADREDRARRVLRYYDVRSLLQGIPYFVAPDLGLYLSGGTGSRLLAPLQDDLAPDLSSIVDLLQRQVTPEAWGAVAEMAEFNGMLAITHDPEGHEAIAAFLLTQERRQRRHIICRIHRITSQDAVTPVLDADTTHRLLAGSVPSGVIVLRDGQRNHHYSGIERALIVDSDVIQQIQAPVVAVLADGLVVDVQAQITIGGILASIHFVHAEMGEDRSAPVRANDSDMVLVPVDQPSQRRALTQDVRLIPRGGATLHVVGNQRYVIEFALVE